MPWNGSGVFNRIYSWVADKAAGLDISSTRMDTDTDDIAANGFGNCLTRDGQGQATANLGMAGFRHQNVGNGQARTDYSSLGQAQDGLVGWVVAGGTSDAITATYTPAHGAPVDGQLFAFRATAANTTTTPTFAPDGNTAQVITRSGGQALGIGDIAGNLGEYFLRYNLANTRYELLNPNPTSGFSTGDIKATLKTVADTGWILMNDGTIGNTSSGANYANANAQALFLLLWNNVSNSFAPVTGGRGANALADWNAQKPIALTKVLGRALSVAGAGSGLTARSLGQATGAETNTISQGNLPNASLPVTDPQHSHAIASPGGPLVLVGLGTTVFVTGAGANALSSGSDARLLSTGTASTGISVSTGGSGTAMSILSPLSSFNIMIKL